MRHTSFKKNIPAFAALLEKINVSAVTQDVYAADYLQELLSHKEHYLHIYALTLDEVFTASDKLPGDVTLLDFGAGNGLLALFAKFCGVREVHASDMNAAFLLSAQQLSSILNIALDGWIMGNEDALLKHFTSSTPDIIIGTDVIEHIYDLDHFLTVLHTLNPVAYTAFTTASVAENPFKSARLKKLQRKDELEGSNALHSIDGNQYSGLPFLETRRKMIAARYPSMPFDIVTLHARNTRGLREDDIYKVVDEAKKAMQLTKPIKHPTNTCDPVTGSWTERLLSIDEYRELYDKHGYHLQVTNGFYNNFEHGFGTIIKSIMNGVIKLLGKRGIVIAPFICLTGIPKQS